MTDYNAMDNEELSAEVARRLFGLVLCEDAHCLERNNIHYVGRDGKWAAHEPYADDHNAAMGLVVPEMRKRKWHFFLDEKNEQVLASFWRWQVAPKAGIPDANAVVPFGQEPRGICLAALAALDAEEEARVHALLDASHTRSMARISQSDPLNCPRCSFPRPEPHLHPGDAAALDAEEAK